MTSAYLKFLTLTLFGSLALMPFCAMAEDIDIFVGSSGGSASSSNVLIVLDNTSNWSANNQGWPGGITQGQAEVNALKQLIATLDSSVNVGLMLLTTTAGFPGGMMVFGIKPMTAVNITTWQSWLTDRYNNITNSTWKAPASANYGAAMFDAFKYFGGYTSPIHSTDDIAGTPVNRTNFGNIHYATITNGQVDSTAYSADFTQYVSPAVSACAKNYIIFIGNGFPNQDDTTLLPGVGGNTTAILPNPMDGGSKVYTADEWARFLYLTDVSSASGRQNVVTYTVDVFGPTGGGPTHPKQAQYLANMAKAGGGKYYSAQNSADVLSSLQKTFAEIRGVNGTFASASMPVNTTNRAQDKNQVFIPMFRPDPNAAPRWMGNLKQYQLINSAGSIELGDSAGNLAVSSLSGFPTDCATSFWTTDSGTYWSTVTQNPSPKGQCPSAATSFDPYSDAPDGPFVEKGGIAEVIRKGNNPPATNTTPTWAVNRTIYTQSGASLTAFNTTSSGLSASVVNFVSGRDVNDENGNGNTTESRPSLHGDAIHSRPLPIDYGGTTGVTVYYGANDGAFRAVDSTTGRERWAFIAPEFFTGSSLSRLMNNSPQIVNYFPGASAATVIPTPLPKNYFFDGSTGAYQAPNNSSVWIYPTMRRGGRMIYALDVTYPASPAFKWKVGCPNLSSDTGCTASMSGIGQTWSMPVVAPTALGYTGPIVIVGGGYDTCEDADSATPSCASPKGAGVYVLDANTGAIIKSFSTTRSVAADVALVAVTTAGVVDHAYAVDIGGNIYRIDFASQVSNWTMNRVAYTNGAGRKFFFPPAVLPAPGGKVYVALGSGDREHPLQSQYPYGNVTNRFYVYLDDLSATTANNLDSTTLATDFTGSTTCGAAGIFPTSSLKGWFMNLNQNGTGEQTVTSAVIAAGMVTFSTNRPVPAAAGTCSTSLGEARGYWVNLFNGSGAIGVAGACGGSRSSTFVGGGLPPSPVVGTVPIDGVPTTVVIGAANRSHGASTPISPQQIKPAITMKRKTVYWKSSGEN